MHGVSVLAVVALAVGCEDLIRNPPIGGNDASSSDVASLPDGEVGVSPTDVGADVAMVDATSPPDHTIADVTSPPDHTIVDATSDAVVSDTLDAPSDTPVTDDRSTTPDGDVASADAADAVAPVDAPPSLDVATVDTPCATGRTLCGATCVDTQTNAEHCGACGRACPSDQRRTDGTCQALTQRSCSAGRRGCGMVRIDGGGFTMGTATQCFSFPDAVCAYGSAPEQPNVTVSSFAIDAYEVTVARFNVYWSVRLSEMATVRSAPIRYRGGVIPWQPPPTVEPTAQNVNYNWSRVSTVRDDHPINGIDYWMAQEFCVWDGGRLPTEAEWEYAARGSARAGLAAGRRYPWGDDPPSTSVCDRARWGHASCGPGENLARTDRVGRYPAGAAGGVFDLAGNVYELVADSATPYSSSVAPEACSNRSGLIDPLCYVAGATGTRTRGGGWGDAESASLRAASRASVNPLLRSFLVGFRCARDVP